MGEWAKGHPPAPSIRGGMANGRMYDNGRMGEWRMATISSPFRRRPLLPLQREDAPGDGLTPVNEHLAVAAVERERDRGAGTQAQETRFGGLRERIRLAAVSQLMQDAVFACH